MRLSPQLFGNLCLKTLPIHLIFQFVFCFSSFSQINIDFAEGDLSSWTGDLQKFSVTSESLKLTAPAENSIAYLSTASTIARNVAWHFTTSLDFNPSSSNFVRVYLLSSQEDLTQPLKGYYILLGGAGDEISLVYQDGTEHTKIIDGPDGQLNLSRFTAKLSVLQDSQGNWAMSGTVNDVPIPRLTGFHLNAQAFTSFGIFCAYTTTRSDKFTFDDIVVESYQVPDIFPPRLISIQIPSENTITLEFSEALSGSTALNIMNYTLDNVISPVEANTEAPHLVTLKFLPLTDGTTYSLQVTNLEDISHNVMSAETVQFVYRYSVRAAWQDIIFNEIMADPSPSAGLLEYEYIELYNRSDRVLQLAGWKISDTRTSALLPPVSLSPGEYALLVPAGNEFQNNGGVFIELQGWPTLNNDGDTLTLVTADGIRVDSIAYSSEWIAKERRNGGWSLELIDQHRLCNEAHNWAVSENEKGGTPGYENSIAGERPDLQGPRLTSCFALDNSTLELSFNEKLDILSTPEVIFDPSISVTNISFHLDQRKVACRVQFPFLDNQGYRIEIGDVRDCTGNLIDSEYTTCNFGLPKKPSAEDIVINEILFNPTSTGVDFVELYNRSDKYVNLTGWTIGNNASTTRFCKQNLLFSPQQYLVLTPDEEILISEYLSAADKKIIVTDLPAFNDEDGIIVVKDEDTIVIDSLGYTEDMHNVLVLDAEGYSLERIDPFGPTNNTANWQSCAAALKATPGAINSNYLLRGTESDKVWVDPPIFIPGSPGGFSLVNYNFDHGGLVANVRIINANGQLVRRLVSNELIGISGFFRWDGETDDGSKARIGIYMINVEVFNAEGYVAAYRVPVVVATRF